MTALLRNPGLKEKKEGTIQSVMKWAIAEALQISPSVTEREKGSSQKKGDRTYVQMGGYE